MCFTPDGEKNPYKERIIKDADKAGDIAMAMTHENDAKRSDLENTVHNIDAYVTRTAAVLRSIITQPVRITEYVSRGINKELKKTDGNLVNDLFGVLKGASDGFIDGFHQAICTDVGQLLNRMRIK